MYVNPKNLVGLVGMLKNIITMKNNNLKNQSLHNHTNLLASNYAKLNWRKGCLILKYFKTCLNHFQVNELIVSSW